MRYDRDGNNDHFFFLLPTTTDNKTADKTARRGRVTPVIHIKELLVLDMKIRSEHKAPSFHSRPAFHNNQK